MQTVKFTHRNLNLQGNTRDEKLQSYIQQIGGTGALLEYILLNLKITEENISDAKLID